MALLLPLVPSNPNYVFSCIVVNQEVSIRVRWNARDSAWYMDWSDANGGRIIAGMKIVLGVNLGRASTHELFKRIIVRAVDTSNRGAEAGFDDIGVRVVVRVYTISDDGVVE